VATVSDSGVVTGVAMGTAVINLTADGKRGSANITVTPPPVASVTVAPAGGTLRVGAALEVKATTRDKQGGILTDRPVSWTSSDPAVLGVTSAGALTAYAPGTVVITASSEGITGTATFSVTAMPIGSITVSPAAATVPAGNTLTLETVVRDSVGTQIVGRQIAWSTSAPTVATVSANGTVSGVSPGTATITATIEGKSATAAIEVSLPVFSPTKPASLGGHLVLASVNIPTGVMVSVT
jgi:uncharacterized protein YjdB